MMCIALCPLTKIFVPYFHVYKPDDPRQLVETVTREQLLKTPDRIYKEELFSIVVRREVGAVNFLYNRPRTIPDPLLRTWLTNPNNQETDCYGIVEMPLDEDTQAALTYFLTHNRTPDKILTEQVTEARQKAKEMSHTRVIENIRRVNKAMRRQYELNAEQKLGDFVPSPVEYLCAYALAEEQTKSAAELQAVKESFKRLMQQTAPR